MTEPSTPPPRPRRLWLHLLLLLATCATTFQAGSQDGDFLAGLVYMSAIMGILLVHEMGHFTAARVHHVDASLPYFIPVPYTPLGTFGAVITMREPPRRQAALLDIGAAGPLAGVLVAIPVCYLGLTLSEVRPLAELPPGAVLEGNSLLYLLLKHLAHPGLLPGDDIWLHPLAWAGWIGLLVTSLNLLPAGQLDGGHVTYALFGPRWHARLARLVRAGVLVLGLLGLACTLALTWQPWVDRLVAEGLIGWVLRGAGMAGWLLWAVLLHFIGRQHPPVQDEATPLAPARRLVGWACVGLAIATFTPVFLSQVTP
ncbi:MAG TPA: site-2 protease family protein [Myxococcota bacterium]|nr:site-2 protease family protein [Myxococcota bacterium]HRY93198.1 site-2 protease family protein [Myxococcota bacterium]